MTVEDKPISKPIPQESYPPTIIAELDSIPIAPRPAPPATNIPIASVPEGIAELPAPEPKALVPAITQAPERVVAQIPMPFLELTAPVVPPKIPLDAEEKQTVEMVVASPPPAPAPAATAPLAETKVPATEEKAPATA